MIHPETQAKSKWTKPAHTRIYKLKHMRAAKESEALLCSEAHP